MNIKLKSGEQLELSNIPLGSPGAEGAVYSITSPKKYSSYCVKLYNDKIDINQYQEKIQYMVNTPPEKLEDKTYRICWPKEMVLKNNQFAGFMMPKAFEESTTGFDLCQLNLSTKLSKEWHLDYQRGDAYCLVNRLKLSVNIALAIHRIHSQKQYTLVDLKPQNFLVNRGGKVSIIDTDGIQINENGIVKYGAKLSTPEYMPPEAKIYDSMTQWVPQSWDGFAYAAIIYQILIGIHPYAGTSKHPYEDKNTILEKIQNGLFPFGSNSRYMEVTPEPHKLFTKLPLKIRQLFLNALNGDPLKRPTIKDWGVSIYEEVTTAQQNGYKRPTEVKSQTNNFKAKPLPAKTSTNNTTKREIYKTASNKTITNKNKNLGTSGQKQPSWGNKKSSVNNIASRTKRFFAALIDIVFLIVIMTIIVVFLNIPENLDTIIGIIIYTLYFSFLEGSSQQASWGKQILNIKVVDAESKQDISFGQAIGRTILKSIPVIGTIAIISILFSSKNAGLHDKAADTLVVEK